jgi:isoleucyl-tRNA synthetase
LEGLARETIRLIQETRKSLGLEVTDRIQVTYQADSQLASAIRRHSTEIAEEVLAVALTAGTESTSASASEEELGLKIWITKV